MTVRIAIIGAGAVSDYHHVPGIRLDPRARLVGACDSNAELLAQRKRDWQVELAVAEEQQGQGIGGRLHDHLLASQPCPRALISTNVTNQRARRIYERRGWYYLHESFDVPGDPHRYVIMAKELGASDG